MPISTSFMVYSDDARVVLYAEDSLAVDHFAVYQVPITLPRPAFSDLLNLVVHDRVAKVTFAVEGLLRGKGVVRSISFSTKPVPSLAED